MTAAALRVLIVDDEPLGRRGVRVRLARSPGFEIVGESRNGRDAVTAIHSLAPDLVFLDVQMPGIDGFGVIERVGSDRMPVVVFVTAHDAHAIRAFDAQALDYLLKPIDDDRFDRALVRVRARVAERRESGVARRLTALLAEPPGARARPEPRPGRIVVKDRGRVVLLDVGEIDAITADGDYVRVRARGRSYLVRDTLAAMDARLDGARFARVHRSTIVNIERIRELEPLPNREFHLVLRDGTRLRSSRTYADRVHHLVGGSR